MYPDFDQKAVADLKKRLHIDKAQFTSEEILCVLLSFVVPQAKLNHCLRTLLERFKSLSLILDAPIDELLQIDSVPLKVATFLKLMPSLFRIYATNQTTFSRLRTVDEAGEYLKTKFIGREVEHLVLVCLNQQFKIIHDCVISIGSVNASSVNIRKIVQTALKNATRYIYIAHNHPHGFAIPSPDDISTTIKLNAALNMVNIKLLDHLIYGSDHDYISLSQSRKYCHLFIESFD